VITGCCYFFLSEGLFQAKHVNGEHSWGVNGETGKIVDMKTYGLYESASVKVNNHIHLDDIHVY